MIAIYDSNRPGFAAVLVDTDKKIVIRDLTKTGDGWELAKQYKQTNGLREGTRRIAEVFKGFSNDVAAQTTEQTASFNKPSITSKYNIATRFEFMEQLIGMVIKNVSPSAIITGPGGIGKTYTVIKELEKAGYKETDYILIKGFTTPLGLFRTLHDNRRAMIVFDDCDSAFSEPTSLNLLKGALDSTDKRTISWNSSRLPEEMSSTFEFRGRVIFISNIPIRDFDQTLVSRSMIIDLQMSREEVIDRIAEIGHVIGDKAEPIAVEDVLAFLRENKDSMSDLNIRTFIKVLKIRLYNKAETWRGMAEFMCCS
jgi:hypothetical protein